MAKETPNFVNILDSPKQIFATIAMDLMLPTAKHFVSCAVNGMELEFYSQLNRFLIYFGFPAI